jgi:hypothetical protein
MNDSKSLPVVSEESTTGLPWPKSWSGAYIFVVATFILWLALLMLLTECCT